MSSRRERREDAETAKEKDLNEKEM